MVNIFIFFYFWIRIQILLATTLTLSRFKKFQNDHSFEHFILAKFDLFQIDVTIIYVITFELAIRNGFSPRSTFSTRDHDTTSTLKIKHMSLLIYLLVNTFLVDVILTTHTLTSMIYYMLWSIDRYSHEHQTQHIWDVYPDKILRKWHNSK